MNFIFLGSNSKLIKIYAFILRSHMAELNVLYLAHMELVIKIYQFPLHNPKLVASGINPVFPSLSGMVDILPGQINQKDIRVLVSLNAFFFAFIFITTFCKYNRKTFFCNDLVDFQFKHYFLKAYSFVVVYND